MRLIIFACILGFAAASHFRGMSFTSKPVTGPDVPANTMSITYRISWCRSSSSNYCDQSKIDSQVLIGGGAQIYCVKGCTGVAWPNSNFVCTDFSESEDWTTGQWTFNYTFSGPGKYAIRFTGSAWISLVTGGGSWEVRLKLDLTPRLDNGKLNTSPITSITPIVRLQYGCNSTITIPVDDADGDPVRCRWAESSLGECSGVCKTFPNSILSEGDCRISYAAVYATGWYAVAIMVEDFATETSTEPLSSIPVQFLVYVFSSTEACTSKPEFVGRTRADKSCIGVPFGEILEEQVVVKSEAVIITDITTSSPLGLVKSSVEQVSEGLNQWYINYTWSPSNDQLGLNIFCFQGKDSVGLSTEQRCVTLLGGVEAPSYIFDSRSPSPGSLIFPNHTKWSIMVNMEFARPQRSTYIRVYESESGKEVLTLDASTTSMATYPPSNAGRTFHFETHTTFKEKTKYYILFDPGVAVGTTYCGAEADGIYEQTWEVTIMDITAPIVTFPDAVLRTAENITLTINLNEEGNTSCSLQSPVTTRRVDCHDSMFSTYGLAVEGYYTLFVTATDVAGNIATARLTWFVDLTPPVARLDSMPNTVSNLTRPILRFSCNEGIRCSYKCSYTEQGDDDVFTDCSGSIQDDVKNSRTYVFKVYAIDNVGNIGSVVEHEWLADFIAPVLSNISDAAVKCGESYLPEDIGMPVVQDNYDLNPALSHVDIALPECKLSRKWTATDSAGNTQTETQIISFISVLPPHVQYEATLILACEDFAEAEEEKKRYQRAIVVSHPCDRSTDLSYTDSVDQTTCGTTFTRSWKVTDDCGEEFTFTQTVRILELIDPLYPANGQVNVALDASLSWPSYPGAALYNVYVWEYGTDQPAEPTQVTGQRMYSPSQHFLPTSMILWQIEFIVDDVIFPSPIWGFTTRSYANLMVSNIMTPDTAFSGQSFEIQWTVENKGDLGTVVSTWYDSVYYGKQSDIQNAKIVTNVRQQRFLDPNDGYTATATINLQKDEVGAYFVFVKADTYRQIDDYSRDNNILRSTSPVQVSLTPPPNLQVTQIEASPTTYSGESIFVTWTVSNTGVGPTVESFWKDRLYLSSDEMLDSSDYILGTYDHTADLLPDSGYTTTESVRVPNAINGEYFIIIHTDYDNHVYEHGQDDDNIGITEDHVSVTLAPPPDFVVTKLEAPSELLTGDTLTVNYEVKNQGYGPPFETHPWTDVLMLNNLVMAQKTILKPFESGDSYSETMKAVVPANIEPGLYTLEIKTDKMNSIFESDAEDNNAKSVKLQIINLPSDLAVSWLNATVDYDSRAAFVTLKYKVVNNGPGSTNGHSWYDAIYLSRTPNLVVYEHPYLLKRSLHNGPQQDEQYSVELRNLPIPREYFGNMFLVAMIDSQSNLDETNENNNILGSEQLLLPNVFPALVTGSVIVENVISAGTNLSLTWAILNEGLGTFFTNPNAFFTIFLSKKANLDFSAQILKKYVINENIEPGVDHEIEVEIPLPEELAGTYHIIAEIPQEANPMEDDQDQLIYSRELLIQSQPTANLVIEIEQISKDSDEDFLQITWKVTNLGNSMTNPKTWCDIITIGTTLGTIGLGTITLGEECRTGKLMHKQSITVTKSFLVSQVPRGAYVVHIQTDSRQAVEENDSENDNVAISEDVINISKELVVDLQLSSVVFNAPAQVVAGDDITVSFTVTNQGAYSTRVQSWTDGVFIHHEKLATANEVLQRGFFLKQSLHSGRLGLGEKYSSIIRFPFPYGFNLPVFWYLVVDKNDNLGSELFESSSFSTEILVDVLPDLGFIAPDLSDPSLWSTISGQPYDLIVSIQNTGKVSVRSSTKWYCTIFLSTDTVVDPFDTKLISAEIMEAIGINETINKPISLFIPYDIATMAYYLIIIADVRNEVYEIDEDNNVLILLLNVKETSSTDIAVEDVKFSHGEVSFLQEFDLAWKLTNRGALDVSGYKCDALYLSEDAQWDITDTEMTHPVCQVASFRAGVPVDFMKSAIQAPLVVDAELHGVVRTRSNIRDSHLENNIGISAATIRVSYPELQLDVPSSHTVKEAAGFIIRDVPFGKTLIITAESGTGLHDIYIKFKEPPTAYSYDFSSTFPTSSMQQSLVTLTQEGNFYLLIDNADTTQVDMNILVKVAKYEILSVTPNKISLQKKSTLHLHGTLFGEVSDVTLSHSDVTIRASRVYRMSSTDVYATFSGPFKMGVYDLIMHDVVSKQNSTLPSAVEAQAIRTGTFSSSLTLQRSMRPGQTGTGHAILLNNGHSDVRGLFMEVTSYGVGHVQLMQNAESIADFQSSHLLLPFSNDGPTGILRPRESSILEFVMAPKFENSVGDILVRLSISPLKLDEANPLIINENKYKKLYWNGAQWDPVWGNFKQALGESAKSAALQLSELSNTLSLVGQKVVIVDDLVNYQLKLSDGWQTGDTVLESTDIAVSSPFLNKIFHVQRNYPAQITRRRTRSSFGHGWLTPIWFLILQQQDENTVQAYLEAEEIQYTIDSYGKFVSMQHETYVTKCGEYLVFHDPKNGLEMVVDSDKMRPIRIHETGASQEDWVIVHYQDDAIPIALEHRFIWMNLTYNDMGLIDTVVVSDKAGNILQQSDYEYDERFLLTEAVSGYQHWKYTYNNDRDLISAEQGEFTMTLEYNDNFLLSTTTKKANDISEMSGTVWKYFSDGRTVMTSLPENIQTEIIYDQNFNKGSVLQLDGRVAQTKKVYKQQSQYTAIADQVVYREVHDKQANTKAITTSGLDIRYDYSANGEIVKVTTDTEVLFHLNYTDSGRLNWISNEEEDKIQEFDYDENGRLLTNGRETQYEYNEDGSEMSVHHPVGQSTYLTFDAFGRAVNIIAENRVEISYHGNGLPKQFSSLSLQESLTYSYRQDGLLGKIQHSNGFGLIYDYNTHGRLVTLSTSDNPLSPKLLVTVAYDVDGRVTKKEFSSGHSTFYTYDPDTGLLVMLRNQLKDDSIVSEYAVKYDRRGRVIGMNSTDGNWEYEYDANSRLSYWKNSNRMESKVSYNARGNRVNVDNNGEVTSCITNALGQYESCGAESYTWDKNGNMKEANLADGQAETFQFNDNGKLKSIGNERCFFSHDGIGNLVTVTCGASSTSELVDPFAVDGPLPFMKTSAGIVQYTVSAPGHGVIGMINGIDQTFEQFNFDPFGSVTSIVSHDGNVLNHYSYDPFGKILSEQETTVNTFKYKAQLGLQYMSESNVQAYRGSQGKVYLPQLGQYISRPAFRSPTSDGMQSSYQFYRNNPLIAISNNHLSTALQNVQQYFEKVLANDEILDGSQMLHHVAEVNKIILQGAGIIHIPQTTTTCEFTERQTRNVHVERREKRDLSQFGGFILGATLRNPLDFNHYGCHCGAGGGGPKLDAIDECCYVHDNCYGRVEGVCDWWWYNPKWIPYDLAPFSDTPCSTYFNSWCQRITCECDLEAALCFGSHAYNDDLHKEDDPRCETTTTSMPTTTTTTATTTPFTSSTGPTTTLPPPPDCESPPPDGTSSQDCSEWPRSKDPNDILGPSGYGDARFVKATMTLDYTIRFENDANATAPAQRVYIVHTIDGDLDIRTFKVGSLGFGSFNRSIIKGKAYFQENIDFIEEKGYVVRVQAGINVANREATWELTTLDPITGQVPSDALIGFLPPNNGSSGEGYVKFSIRPLPTVQSLAVIDAEATIYFDQNEPIDTPPIFNTIDANEPTCTLGTVDDLIAKGSLVLKLDAGDIGAGIQTIKIYENKDTGSELLSTVDGEDMAMLSVPGGHTYHLFAVAEDNVGYEQMEQMNVIQVYLPLVKVSCADLQNCSNQGNCSSLGLCECYEGYYGEDCSLDVPPLEPPVLEISSEIGEEDLPVKLYLSAHSTNSEASSDIVIEISSILKGFHLNKGTTSNENSVVIQQSDFGEGFELTTPKDFAGSLRIDVLARETYGSQVSERRGKLEISIVARADKPILELDQACFLPDSTNQVIPLPVTKAESTDSDGSENLKMIVDDLPFGVRIQNGFGEVMFQRAELFEWSDAGIQISDGITNAFRLNVTLVADDGGHTANVTARLDVNRCEDDIVTTPLPDEEDKKKGGGKVGSANSLSAAQPLIITGFVLFIWTLST